MLVECPSSGKSKTMSFTDSSASRNLLQTRFVNVTFLLLSFKETSKVLNNDSTTSGDEFDKVESFS